MSRKSVFQRITRRRFYDHDTQNLARVLTIPDLVFLGIGSTLGVGIYVLSGQVAAEKAGPAVSLSFLIAALSSIFAGLCYAEFSARVPRAGSAYVYSYASVGEFIGFTSGWNLVLSYLLGASSVSRGFSGYIDSLTNQTISSYFYSKMPIDIGYLSNYPDILALSMVMLFTCILAIGVSESSFLNNLLCVVNSAVVLYVIICGSFKADISNWMLAGDGSVEKGSGGFFPFGLQGVLAGAATCFYGFVGFDVISATGEEAKNSQTAIPISIMVSLLLVFLCYFGIATVLTLMVPYYEQDPHAPLIVAFEKVGWDVAKWIVAGGAVFGLTASLIGTLFPLPRILYAMSCDGLLFPIFSSVNERFQTPFIGTLISGSIAACLAAILNLEQLVDAMSLGTLAAYSIVAACVMVLRYQPSSHCERRRSSLIPPKSASLKILLKQLVNGKSLETPTEISGTVASYLTLLICGILMGLAALITFGLDQLYEKQMYIIVILCMLLLLLVISVVFLVRQPFELPEGFKAPLVPYLPIVSILANFVLVLQMKGNTWAIYAIWMAIGYLIYFLYGIRHSKEEKLSIVRDRKRMQKNKLKGHKNYAYCNDDPEGPRYSVPEIHVELATPLSSSHTASIQGTVKEKEPEPPHSEYAEFAKSLSESLVKIALENSAEVNKEQGEGQQEGPKVEETHKQELERVESGASNSPGPNQENRDEDELRTQEDGSAPEDDQKPARKISKPSALVLVPDDNAESTPTETNDKDASFQPNTKSKQTPGFKASKPRHPKKQFKRTDSGFDIIPPSSPDSPLAQKITEKFVLIPVDSDPMKNDEAELENMEEDFSESDKVDLTTLEKLPRDQPQETPAVLEGDDGESKVETSLMNEDEVTLPDNEDKIVQDVVPIPASPPSDLAQVKGEHDEAINSPSLNTDVEVKSEDTNPRDKSSPPPKLFGSPEFKAELKKFLGEPSANSVNASDENKENNGKDNDEEPETRANSQKKPRRKMMRSEEFKKLLETFSEKPNP